MDVLCPRVTILFPKKDCISLSSLFAIFYLFVLFKFLTSLKKNKRMLHQKGGMSVTRKKTSSKRMEHIDAHCKETCVGQGQSRKFLHGLRCQITREKMLQGLHLMNYLNVQLNSNMEPTLCQKCKNVTCDAFRLDMTRLLPC